MTKIDDVIDYIVRKNNKCGLKPPDNLNKTKTYKVWSKENGRVEVVKTLGFLKDFQALVNWPATSEKVITYDNKTTHPQLSSETILLVTPCKITFVTIYEDAKEFGSVMQERLLLQTR